MSADSESVTLAWPNKERILLAVGEDSYQWFDPDHERVQEVPSLELLNSLGEVDDGLPAGTVIVGDALDALSAITHERSSAPVDPGISLAYIDPPFNTNQGYGQYTDLVDRALWLSMLRDRLIALQPLLTEESSVWVHLDDAEVHRARCVLDEVFGPEAFVSTIVWQKRTTRESRSAFSSNHDYIHVYAPSGPKKWKKSRNLLPREASAFRNRDDDPRGPWTDAPFTAPGFRRNQQYEIVNPAGASLRPPPGRSWFATEPVFQQYLRENRIWFPRGGAGLPRIKLFPHEVSGLVPFSLWNAEECGTNDDATRHLMALFPDLPPFATPKPETLVERIIHIASNPGDLMIDFFAGSGTTAAVAHKMNRKWIAVERSMKTAQTFLIPRLMKVIAGEDKGGITNTVDWRGGGSFSVFVAQTSTSSPASTTHELAAGIQSGSSATTSQGELDFEVA